MLHDNLLAPYKTPARQVDDALDALGFGPCSPEYRSGDQWVVQARRATFSDERYADYRGRATARDGLDVQGVTTEIDSDPEFGEWLVVRSTHPELEGALTGLLTAAVVLRGEPS